MSPADWLPSPSWPRAFLNFHNKRRQNERGRDKKSPLDLLTDGESQDEATCCNLLTPLLVARAVLLHSLMMPINRVMWSLVGGESESMASLALPLAAQQKAGRQAGRKESSKNVVSFKQLLRKTSNRHSKHIFRLITPPPNNNSCERQN